MMENPSLEDENIIKDIRNLFRFENPKKDGIILNYIIMLNTTVIYIKHYQLKNILIKLGHILKTS